MGSNSQLIFDLFPPLVSEESVQNATQAISKSDIRRLFDPISGLAPPPSYWKIPPAKDWNLDSQLPNIAILRILLGVDNMHYLADAVVRQARLTLGFPPVRPSSKDLRPYCLRFFGLLNDLALASSSDSIAEVLYKVDCAIIRQSVDDIQANMKAWAVSQGLLTQIDVKAPLAEDPTFVSSADKTVIVDMWGL